MFGVLAAISLACCVFNACALLGLRRPCMPFAGGIAGALALLAAPSPGLATWAWIPLVGDPGCGLLVLALFVGVARSVLEDRRRPPVPPMKLLMVEDHQVFADTARATVLARHEVAVVGGVRAAVGALTRLHFDVVLLDHDLPDGTGVDVLHWMRAARRRFSRTPVVAIAAEPENNAALLEAGAHAACGKLDLARIEDVLRGVRPDGGAREFCWKLSHAASTDALVAAVVAFATEVGVTSVRVSELVREPTDLAIDIFDDVAIDEVCAAIRAGATRLRAERDGFAIDVAAGYVCIEAPCWCADAVALATYDFGVRVEVVTRRR